MVTELQYSPLLIVEAFNINLTAPDHLKKSFTLSKSLYSLSSRSKSHSAITGRSVCICVSREHSRLSLGVIGFVCRPVSILKNRVIVILSSSWNLSYSPMANVTKSLFLGHSLENTLSNTFLGTESNELVPQSSKLVVHWQFPHLLSRFINYS